MQIDMMPSETIGGVIFPGYPAAWLAKQLANLDRENSKALFQADVDRLKLMGALEPEFEL